MKSKSMLLFALVVLAVLSYSTLWFQVLKLLQPNLVSLTGLSFEALRGLSSIASGFLASALLFLPVLVVSSRPCWVIPTIVGICGFAAYYILRPIDQEFNSPLQNFYWVFQNLQSVVVMLGLLLAPFISYYLGCRLFNKFRHTDALPRARC